MISYNKTNSVLYIFCSLLLISVPWILLLLIFLFTGASLSGAHPLWSDELIYWHETLSFIQKGVHTGYYTVNELLPHFLSFGAHGFGTTITYSLYAVLLGWNYNSLVLANNLFISFAFMFLIVTVRPPIKKIFLLFVFYLTYMPLVFYCSTSMSELLNYAVLILYFVLLYLYLKSMQDKTNKRNALFAFLLFFSVYISFIRIIYIILILPVLLKKRNVSAFNRNLSVTLVIWLFVSAIIYIVNSLFTSPFPFSFLYRLFHSPSAGCFLYEFQKHFFNNIMLFFSFTKGSFMEILQRYFIFLVWIFLLWKSDIIQSKFKIYKINFLIPFLLLSLLLLINIMAYDVSGWRDYRIIAPLLFGSIVFVTLIENSRLIKYAISFNLIVFVFFVFTFDQYKGFFSAERYETINENIDLKFIEYEAKANSYFENTITIDNFDPDIVLNIPSGLGIDFYLKDSPVNDSLKSKYIYSSKEFILDTYRIISKSDQGILYQKIKD